MSKLVTFLVLSTAFFSCSKSTNKEAEFYVRGNCEMCKERIENAAISVQGVTSAKWDINSSSLKVVFDSTKANEIDLHKTIANTGHGTKLVEMNAKAHDELPECCKVNN